MNRLRELREDRDLIQKEIAKELGISQRNYSYYETNQNYTYRRYVNKIS